VSGFSVVFYGEGLEWRARRGSQFPYWSVVVRVEASAFSGANSRIFNPKLKSAVGTNGGYEIWVDGWREPLDLFNRSVSVLGRGKWLFLLARSHRCAPPTYRTSSMTHPCADCTL
jgi:hypothetical protein